MEGDFSGLNLVCILYAGMQRIAPGQDVGMDLSREYEAAVGLHSGRESATASGK